jgi:hypothetical protein
VKGIDIDTHSSQDYSNMLEKGINRNKQELARTESKRLEQRHQFVPRV